MLATMIFFLGFLKEYNSFKCHMVRTENKAPRQRGRAVHYFLMLSDFQGYNMTSVNCGASHSQGKYDSKY